MPGPRRVKCNVAGGDTKTGTQWVLGWYSIALVY